MIQLCLVYFLGIIYVWMGPQNSREAVGEADATGTNFPGRQRSLYLRILSSQHLSSQCRTQIWVLIFAGFDRADLLGHSYYSSSLVSTLHITGV